MSSSSSHSARHHERPRWQWWLLGFLILLTFVCGVVGFRIYDVDNKLPGDFLDACYHTVQLFLVHEPTLSLPINWFLEIARWLALGLFGYAACSTGLRIFSTELRVMALRRFRGHTILCGQGRTGLELARCTMANQPRRPLVVLLQPGDDSLLHEFEGLRATVLVGRPLSLLERAGLARAARIIVAGEVDGDNVELALRAVVLSHAARSASLPPLNCHVQVGDVDLRDALRRRQLPGTDGRCVVRFFDFFEHAARDVLLNQGQLPLDHHGISATDPRQVHLIIIGFGGMGRALAVKAAQLGHFANHRPLKISVLDADAPAREQSLLFRYPAFHKTCEISFHALPVESAAAYALIEAWCTDQDKIPCLAVCLDNDPLALRLALRLQPLFEAHQVPVTLRMTRPDGLNSLLKAPAVGASLSYYLRSFGWLDTAACARFIAEEVGPRERMAALVQCRFVALAKDQGREGKIDGAVKEWDQLRDEDYKESNRQQVDHIAIKLRAIGCEAAPRTDPRPEVQLTEAEINLLSTMEHARWAAERLLAGWTYAAGKKNPETRTNPNLVPWAELTEPVKEYDRDAVRNIRELLAAVDQQKIVRRQPLG